MTRKNSFFMQGPQEISEGDFSGDFDPIKNSILFPRSERDVRHLETKLGNLELGVHEVNEGRLTCCLDPIVYRIFCPASEVQSTCNAPWSVVDENAVVCEVTVTFH